MLQRFAPGAAQRTSVPGAAEIVTPCPCAAKAVGTIEQTNAAAPSRRRRRRMTTLKFLLARECELSAATRFRLLGGYFRSTTGRVNRAAPPVRTSQKLQRPSHADSCRKMLRREL